MTTSYIALGVTFYVLPGRQSSGPLALAGLVVTVGVVGVLLRPLLAGLAIVAGSLGLLAIGVLSQAIILDVAIALAPDVDASIVQVLLVSWAAAAVAAILNWIIDAGSEEDFLGQLLGRAVRVTHHRRRSTGPDAGVGPKRLLVIQLDGVGEDVLREAITAGHMPTLAGWLRAGTHTLRGWHTGLPATTPAGQAVLLHRDVSEIPSFRWYEKETGHLMVANHPPDAAEIEHRISTGRGLLADGGVSVSNLFSGDAPLPLLTMSHARLPSRRTDGFASFATAPGGLVRSLVVAVGQVVTELYQGARQRRRDVRPRVRRGLLFALQRAITTALLKDLTVAIVAEQIARAAPIIFADLLDYDEVAHHAGPSRPESMRTLDGFDRLLHFFVELIHETGDEYEIVVVSDHGQAQGSTFAQLSGRSLQEVVGDLSTAASGSERLRTGGSVPPEQLEPVAVTADPSPAERWSSATLWLTGVAPERSGVAARAVVRVASQAAPDPQDRTAPGRPRAGGREVPAGAGHLVVAAAGSLAHIYLPDLAGRVTRQEVEARHPHLIEGLAHHPHIGVVLVSAAAPSTLFAIGADGWRILTAAGVAGGEGADPVAVFGPEAAHDLWALDRRRHVGDLVVLGRYDPRSGEVAAFEELVGSHGGLGGGQTGALLVHPSGWLTPGGPVLHGVDVHDLLLRQRAAGPPTDAREAR